MRVVSNLDTYLDACKAPVKQVNARIVVNKAETPQVITSDDNLVSWKLNQNGNFFGSVATQAQIVILRTDWGDLMDASIDVYFSLYDGSEWQEVNCGKFTVIEQVVDMEKDKTTLKLYDQIAMAQQEFYTAEQYQYPTSVRNLADQVATGLGLALNVEDPLTNGLYEVTEDLWATIDQTTIRDVISQIAGATATIARVNAYNGSLDLLPTTYYTEPIELTYDELKQYKKTGYFGKVNTITLSREPQEDNIVVQDEPSVELDGVCQIKLSNNEILDDDREILAQPILDATIGFEYFCGELTTTGIGIFECGDYVKVNDGTNSFLMLITEAELTVDGGLKEKLKCVPFDEKQTNYAIAGSIYKTVWNTEIKVDKQGNDITSVVSRQDEFEGQTLQNFTEVYQNIDNVVTSVQKSGGANMVENSVGFILDENKLPKYWAIQGGLIEAKSDPESRVYGALSGNSMLLSLGVKITQRITVMSGEAYSLSVKVRKLPIGTFTLRLFNGTDDYRIEIPATESPYYTTYSLTGVIANENYFDLEISVSEDAEVSITDLILSLGDYNKQWEQSNSEFANTQVKIDTGGVTVVESNKTDDYTEQSPQDFTVYKDGEITGRLDQDGLRANNGRFTNQISMPPVKIIPIKTGSNAGWAFVKTEE